MSGWESDGEKTGDDESHESPISSSDDDTPTNVCCPFAHCSAQKPG